MLPGRQSPIPILHYHHFQIIFVEAVMVLRRKIENTMHADKFRGFLDVIPDFRGIGTYRLQGGDSQIHGIPGMTPKGGNGLFVALFVGFGVFHNGFLLGLAVRQDGPDIHSRQGQQNPFGSLSGKLQILATAKAVALEEGNGIHAEVSPVLDGDDLGGANGPADNGLGLGGADFCQLGGEIGILRPEAFVGEEGDAVFGASLRNSSLALAP